MTAAAAGPATGTEPRGWTGEQGRGVLVVDDDDTVREVLRRYLARDGHEVLEAADGRPAWSAPGPRIPTWSCST